MLIHDGKRVENRSWRCHYRGPLAIHASRSTRGYKEAKVIYPELPPLADLALGAVIGTLDLIDCIPIEQLEETSHDVGHRQYISGPWLWITANARPLVRPVACPGQLSFFNVELPPDLLPSGA
jgi:hypothetical protein